MNKNTPIFQTNIVFLSYFVWSISYFIFERNDFKFFKTCIFLKKNATDTIQGQFRLISISRADDCDLQESAKCCEWRERRYNLNKDYHVIYFCICNNNDWWFDASACVIRCGLIMNKIRYFANLHIWWDNVSRCALDILVPSCHDHVTICYYDSFRIR